MPFAATWMELEIIILSEVSQTEKDKYRILTHICGIQKNGRDEPICKAEIETQTQRANIWKPSLSNLKKKKMHTIVHEY